MKQLHQLIFYFTLINGEWRCTYYGKDICVIPKEKIQPNKTFYATIFCENECDYVLTVKASPEYKLKRGVPINDRLEENSNRIYRFSVPVKKEIESISIDLQFKESESDKVRMFVTKAPTVPSTSKSLRVLPTWLGYGARFYQTDSDSFCTGCQYLVMVSSSIDVQYTLEVRTNEEVTHIRTQKFEKYELIQPNTQNCYTYKVFDPISDLNIILNPFSGNPNLYVNPLTRPTQLNQFKYSSSEHLEEQLVLTPKERKTDGGETTIEY